MIFLLKIILIFIAILIGIFVLAIVISFFIGRYLRKDYVGSVKAIIDRPIEDVWAAIIDGQTNPISAGMCKSVTIETDSNGNETLVENIGASKLYVTTESKVELQSLVRLSKDSVVPMTSRCTVLLETIGDGCQITATNNITVENGTWHVPIFRVLLFTFGLARKGMKTYLKQIAKNLETKPDFNV